MKLPDKPIVKYVCVVQFVFPAITVRKVIPGLLARTCFVSTALKNASHHNPLSSRKTF